MMRILTIKSVNGGEWTASWFLIPTISWMPLLIIAGILIIYGLFALFSVSIHESFTTTLKLINKGLMEWDPSNYFYFFKQVINIVRWIGAWLLVYFFPLKNFKNPRFLTVLSIIILLFQFAVFIPGIGISLNGARWWLNIPWLPSIQPSEFFKIGYVIFLARWFIRKKYLLGGIDILKKYFVVHIAIFFVFLLIPDLGSVVVMAITGLIMARYIGVKKRNILWMIGIGSLVWVAGLLGLFSFNNTFCTEDYNKVTKPAYCKFTYITKRVSVYINPSNDQTGKDSDRQNRQALIAIGAGGFFWQWYGKGLQKFWYIPEAQSDFIFAAFAEELWFVNTLILLGLYGALIWYTLIKVPAQRDEHMRLVSIWLLSLIIVQAFVNISVNIKLLPNTGLTLPFISYGWTALMTNIIVIVLLYKILYAKNNN